MRHLYCAIMAMALVPTGLTTDVDQVSLSKFVPRIENLPQTCQTAYNTSIQGCTRADFPKDRDPSINNCSNDCVQGIVKIAQLVNQQCSRVNVPADSIIGVALSGDLLPKLCGNVVVVTSGQHTSTMSTSSTSASASASTSTSTSKDTKSSSGQSTSASTAASSAVTSSSQTIELGPSSTNDGIEIDTATPPPAPSETAIPQKSNPDSGGGSPFDVTLSTTSSAPSHLRFAGIATTVLLSVACLVLFI